MGEYLQFNMLLDMMVEIEEVIQKILSKKEVDEDTYKLRDTLYKLIRLEIQRVIRETKE